jgi:toxin CcdB
MPSSVLAPVPVSILRERVASLAGHDVEIGGALDMLFVGF